MKKEFLKKIEERLKKEKTSVEELLRGFAKKDKELKGDSGGGALEMEADEVQEYESKLDIEHILEIKLKGINLALQKIKKRKYGICEKCGQTISQKRLMVSPEARFCLKCQKT